MMRHRLGRAAVLAALSLALALGGLVPSPAGSPALAASNPPEGWNTDPTFSVDFLGRNGPDATDHYLATFGWGGTFFGTAVASMPLLPAEQSVSILTQAYEAAFPGRPLQAVQPGDSFEFQVPLGTIVTTQWRQVGSVREYRSLRGDLLELDANPRALLVYRLIRAEDPNSAEVKINRDVLQKPYDLARALYSQGDPNFAPDFLQVKRARDAIEQNADLVRVDLTRRYLDDFREIRGNGELRGKTKEGLDLYYFPPSSQANPLFRVEDGVGDGTDLSTLPSPLRVYYYKDGTVRTFQRAADATFLSGRQPRTDDWTKVYQDYGQTNPAPNRWQIGQPEQDGAAQELRKLGVVVLRFEPLHPPPGNFLTHLLDQLMALMKRKEG